jgi:hypothetical protein
MREIKLIGQRKQGRRNYLFSLFECNVCGCHIEKIRKDGLAAKYCSHECYAISREKRGAYKGGTIMISGYIYEYKPDHPNCTKNWYVAQHRLVLENRLGRFLTEDEIAHHENEIKTDNSPDNILLMTKSTHSKHHQNFKKCKTVL